MSIAIYVIIALLVQVLALLIIHDRTVKPLTQTWMAWQNAAEMLLRRALPEDKFGALEQLHNDLPAGLQKTSIKNRADGLADRLTAIERARAQNLARQEESLSDPHHVDPAPVE